MTDALVEAVAKAMCADNEPNNNPIEHAMGWRDYESMARAALAAIEASGSHAVVPVYEAAFAARPRITP